MTALIDKINYCIGYYTSMQRKVEEEEANDRYSMSENDRGYLSGQSYAYSEIIDDLENLLKIASKFSNKSKS